jgi:cell shape-determining protein MreD
MNPFTITLLVTSAVVVARVLYVLLSLLLGEDVGSFISIITSLFIGALWSAAIVPILMPFVARAYDFIDDSRHRL